MRIGVDIGGTNIGLGLVDKKGNIEYKKEFETEKEKGYDYIISKLVGEIRQVINEAGARKIELIGLGIPGVRDQADRVYCTNLGWVGLPLMEDLKASFEIPIFIENDASLAAIAEASLGSSKGYSRSVLLTLGTGLGGGIILNNKIYTGAHGVGAEIGHMIVGKNFYDCSCGNNGCLETFTSAIALEKFVQNEGKLTNPLKAKEIFDLAKKGDKVSLRAVDRMVKYLSIGIVNLINLLDPEIIVIGGGLSKAGNFLLEKINIEYPKHLLFPNISYGKVSLSRLGNDAGIIGASMVGQFK